ncbi:carboxymuconolactone decarboxylase family protein [Sphingomonas sp. MG17]|uniref:Carboxymuconolactone decarboxylase family protein n=1 Tax=Sphingomonas tagetis TaxID=2949092 RepID=A0A9X2HSS5_9SPHN|nr:carboxymuconolactone decarboxylase family protein [Sphingomonas tagetis]MCP3731250.1 carboxymuconolactone decarboxylase family protein [Sphingomonas tagetis]
MDEVTKRGLAFFGQVMGDGPAQAMRDAMDSSGFGAPLARLAADYAFGSVWTREGLGRKERSLVVIGVLIAQGQPHELKNHIRIGLKNGLTPKEIEEALIQTLPYAGFPAVSSALTSVVEVLRELGIDRDTPTSEERGLL